MVYYEKLKSEEVYLFLDFWLRSSVISFLISLIYDTRLIELHDINLISLRGGFIWQLVVRAC